jgi:hypothetical protein
VVVLEGQARGAAASSSHITVVDAAVGDDEVVAQAASHASRGHVVTVVTADRGLRRRVGDARVVGPSALTTVLSAQADSSTDWRNSRGP